MKDVISKPTSRKLQAEERRQQILESALDVFAGKGYSHTTVKDLAEAAGISDGLMYHYFSGKEQLLEEAMKQESFLPYLQEIMEGTSHIPCRKVLKDIGYGFLSLLRERKRIIEVFIREGYSNRTVQSIWSSLVCEGVAMLSDYFNTRVANGELKPHNTEITARCLFSSVLLLYFTRDILTFTGMTEERFVNELVDNLLDGIENKPGTIEKE
jgi:TetR/AcrR family transcriptional regulator, cholesterol catabolism regulator